jgi:putative NADH-flavin reductase
VNIAIIGASGNVGRRMLDEALRRGHGVTAIARNAGSLVPRAGLRVVTADILDAGAATPALRGQDCAIVSLRYSGLDFERLLEVLKKSGVPRVVFVGGAASLEVSPGTALLDTPGFPEQYRAEAELARQALNRLRQEKQLDWTFVSPSVMFGPGKRTGQFRLGKDQLLTAADGQSHISYEDFAVAVLDEIEQPKHRRERFTVGY